MRPETSPAPHAQPSQDLPTNPERGLTFMTWTVPNLFTAGTALAAAELNKIRDSLKAIGDPWTAYTPAWTAATTNPVIGNGSVTGIYMLAGKLVIFRASILTGSTTTYGAGAYSITLPVTPNSHAQIFDGYLIDSSASANYITFGVPRVGSATVDLHVDPLTAGNPLRAANATTPVALASGDRLSIAGVYEAA